MTQRDRDRAGRFIAGPRGGVTAEIRRLQRQRLIDRLADEAEISDDERTPSPDFTPEPLPAAVEPPRAPTVPGGVRAPLPSSDWLRDSIELHRY